MQQPDLLTQISSKPQREVSGADTARRFDYQKSWAFCEMLERHISGADYLVAFEFHDDVVFLDTSSVPQKAEFCQVKTNKNSKPKALASLLRRPKKAGQVTGNSVVGKMCLNFSGLCKSHDLKVVLISNVSFDFEGAKICAKDLDEKAKSKIVARMKEEVPDWTDSLLEKMHFLVTGVSLDAMHSYLHGEATRLFKHQFGEAHGINIHSWVRLVQGEINRKNNHPSDSIVSAQELIDQKCIGRPFVQATLSQVSQKSAPPPNMVIVGAELVKSGWTSTEVMRVEKNIVTAIRDYSDPTNDDVSQMAERLKIRLDVNKFDDLLAFVSHVQENAEEFSSGMSVYDQVHYQVALAIVVFHEKL